jgi:hypothetical protein
MNDPPKRIAYDIAMPIHALATSKPKRPAVMRVFRAKFFFCTTTPIRNEKVVTTICRWIAKKGEAKRTPYAGFFISIARLF